MELESLPTILISKHNTLVEMCNPQQYRQHGIAPYILQKPMAIETLKPKVFYTINHLWDPHSTNRSLCRQDHQAPICYQGTCLGCRIRMRLQSLCKSILEPHITDSTKDNTRTTSGGDLGCTLLAQYNRVSPTPTPSSIMSPSFIDASGNTNDIPQNASSFTT